MAERARSREATLRADAYYVKEAKARAALEQFQEKAAAEEHNDAVDRWRHEQQVGSNWRSSIDY